MDNCDLEKLTVSAGMLHPTFSPLLTSYKVIVPSNISKITLDLLTSDSGASYKILCGSGSMVIELKDGVNKVDIEVIAEDGTAKIYTVEVTKLSASAAELSGLEFPEGLQLQPAFATTIFEYSCTVPFNLNALTVQPKVPDSNMKVSVNEADPSDSVPLTVGDSLLEVKVSSADGTRSCIYTILITREQIPYVITFNTVKDQMEYECPVSLTAFYRPVSISGSDPKHAFSAPYIDVLTRRSKVDPLDESPLGESWKVTEYEVDRRMSAASVKCCFAYRGCEIVLKLSELGEHVTHCPHKPPSELDVKDVTDSEWYKAQSASSDSLQIETKHTLQIRSWEKRLQKALMEDDVDKLCHHAEEHIKLYKQRLPKSGGITLNEEGESPLDALHQVLVDYASAIKLKPRDPNLHFQLGLAFEEQYYATEIYGLKRKVEDDPQDLSSAKASGREDEILAICKLHGLHGKPTLENQLKALDAEFHQLKEQGQSARADYIQTLFIWLSKKAGKDGRTGVSDEESPLHQAFLKHLDAWSLNPDNWEYNLYVGRFLLLQGKCKEALQHLQTALILRPSWAPTRFYTGLALLQQEGGAGSRVQEAVMYLQQGLEQLLSQQCITEQYTQERKNGLDSANLFSTVNTQLLRGCLSLGTLLKTVKCPEKTMNPEQVFHIVADLAARSVSRCVSRGAALQQLEWTLLEAHYSLVETLLAKPRGNESWIAKRCQGLTALIRLTAIPPCRELLDMQNKVCQLGVLATPCSSHALYLLGLAQLAQYDSDPDSEQGQRAISDARLSFQASINLENMPDSGPPPEKLARQKWWQDWRAREKEKEKTTQQSLTAAGAAGSSSPMPAGKGATRGKGVTARGSVPTPAKASVPSRGGGTPSPRAVPMSKTTAPGSRWQASVVTPEKLNGASKPATKTSSKSQLAPRRSDKQECCQPPQIKPVTAEGNITQELVPASPANSPISINRGSHTHRLGLARALSRTEDTQDQACKLYEEVITMAPEVHDAYIELADLLIKTDPLAAVDVYCKFPLKPVNEQSFDDAFITGEIVRILMKQELYEHPNLASTFIAYGKVMGLGCLEKYINILEGKYKTKLLKTIYAGIHDKSVEDQDLQEFFRFKCWI
ncbi:uncharacterized protein [Lepisosteus oculatus]|uniref:uncharacterized protein n=1 Tax=Lepisosteus oculatus TaxID=7918 RepID=UPI0035F50BF7